MCWHTRAPMKFFTFISGEGKIIPSLGVLLPLLVGKQGGGNADAWDEHKLWQFIRAGTPGEQLAF